MKAFPIRRVFSGEPAFFWPVLLVWVAVVAAASAGYEIYRDEMHVLSVALEPRWLWQMPWAVRNEGHPALWYMVLRAVHGLVGSPVALKAASVAAAAAGAAVFLRTAPFPVWQRALFLFGVLPVFEYSVVPREYGAGFFLVFLFCALYSRGARPLGLGLTLFVLANVNLQYAMAASALLGLWVWERGRVDKAFLAGAFLAAAGIAAAVLTCLPDEQSLVAQPPGAAGYLKALGAALAGPAAPYMNIFPLLGGPARDVLLCVLISGLLSRPAAAAALFAGALMLDVFFMAVYPAMLRHQGVLFMLIVALYWIAAARPAKTSPAGKSERVFQRVHHAVSRWVLTGLLVLHVVMAFHRLRSNFLFEHSAGESFGTFLKAEPARRKAVVLGEPDYFLESLPYYTDNRVYLPREGRFARRVFYTHANRAELTLGELLDAARNFREGEGVPVFIALGISLERSSGLARHSYGKVFSWTEEERRRFEAETVPAADFGFTESDENYRVYELR
ncbi:MAG: hypothetical protein ACT4O3_08190 [Elusimicrobiota bacterium]